MSEQFSIGTKNYKQTNKQNNGIVYCVSNLYSYISDVAKVSGQESKRFITFPCHCFGDMVYGHW